MKNNVFELVKNTDDLVVVKVKDGLTNLDIALNPYLQSNYDYITLTKGEDCNITIIKKDGKTFSYTSGIHGSTCVCKELSDLRQELRNFVQNECHIMLELKGKLGHGKVLIYYNTYFNQWQIQIERVNVPNVYYRSANAQSFEDTLQIFNRMFPQFIGKEWVKKQGFNVPYIYETWF